MSKEQKMKFKIINLSVKDKELSWTMRIKALFGIGEARAKYKMSIQVDDEYFDKKIDVIQHKINERKSNPDMFGDFKSSVKGLEKDIDKVNADRTDAEELEIPEFEVAVVTADFVAGKLALQIPEDRVEDVIKIRKQVEAYVVNLK